MGLDGLAAALDPASIQRLGDGLDETANFLDDKAVVLFLELKKLKVPAELHVYPGACHGFRHFAPDAPVAQQCMRDQEEWLSRQLHRRR